MVELSSQRSDDAAMLSMHISFYKYKTWPLYPKQWHRQPLRRILISKYVRRQLQLKVKLVWLRQIKNN